MKHHMLVEGQTFKYRVFLVFVIVFVVVCTFFSLISCLVTGIV